MIENSLKLHIQQTVVSIVSFLWDFLCVCFTQTILCCNTQQMHNSF